MRLFASILATALMISCHSYEGHADPVITPFLDLVGFLEKFKEVLKKGDSKIGIPPLDPLNVKHLPVNISKEGLVTLNGDLDYVYAGGLSEYDVLRGDFSMVGLKVNVGLHWNEIDLSALYNLTGTLDKDINFYGEGGISAKVNLNVTVDMQIKINSTTKHLYVNQLVVHVYVDKLDFKITGLYNDPDLSETLSKIISDIVPGVVSDYQSLISQNVSPIVRNLLNNILGKFTLGDLLEIIGGNKPRLTNSSI